MSDLLDSLAAEDRSKVRSAAHPRSPEAMLATLKGEPFSDPGWIYERKLDGVRCLVSRDGGEVRIRSRNYKDMDATWPELVDALHEQPLDDFVADGEIVAFEGARTSFSRLQARIGLQDERDARASRVVVHLYLFDLLHVDGHDLTEVPLRARKALLKRALTFEGRVRYTPHRNERGEAWLEEACAKDWEGLIAERADSKYVGSRSRDWLKFKCVNRQELVVGGFTDPRGSRRGFGALLVGHYEDGSLRYAGKVGTGYDDELLESLGRRLERLERRESPFVDEVDEDRAHFVRPELVAECGFTEWTRDGRLRHPRFLGLRTDKAPEDVRREEPEA